MAICGLIYFDVCSLCSSERFFCGYAGLPLSSKTNISNSYSTKNQEDIKNEYYSGCATSGGSRSSDKGRPGHPDPEIRGEGGWALGKYLFGIQFEI